ncbi:MAG: type II secretion system protein [Firmicutes bacterium]|nr:type II secretion system protein [Bacillota bacterium]
MNKKGFTLIELLAVIVIMGILMLVAIPAVQRYIENSKKDTFVNIAEEYIAATKKLMLSGSYVCGEATSDNTYYIPIDSETDGIMESKVVSPFTKRKVVGWILIKKTGDTVKYYILLSDDSKTGYMIKGNGGGNLYNFGIESSSLSRDSVKYQTGSGGYPINGSFGTFPACILTN